MNPIIKRKKSIIVTNLEHFFRVGPELLKYCTDFLAITVAYYMAYFIRFEGEIPAPYFLVFLNTLPAFLTGFSLCEIFIGLSRSLWRYTSVRDLERIAAFILSGLGLSVLLGFIFVPEETRDIPRSIYFIDAVVLLILTGGARIAGKMIFEGSKTVRRIRGKTNILIIGDGDMAASLEADIAKNYPHYRPAGFITADASKVRSTINGVPVIGTHADIKWLVTKRNIKYAFIATEQATAKEMKDTIKMCEDSGVTCKIIPTVTDVIENKFSLRDAREIRFEDYLHREPLNLDMDMMKGDFEGKTVLVTGAGGAIGSQICRELDRFGCKKIILLDHSEGNIFNIYNELVLRYRIEVTRRFSCIIGDVCDAAFMRRVFETAGVDYVIHAAAHKHVYLSEINVIDTARTNVCGTYTMAKLASEFGVGKFVMISTDKAVDPTSVMGATKRVGELIMQALNGEVRTRYIAVRFGNVIGSHGNVVEILQHEILSGEPLTITHPDAERYFMSINEAIKLVLQAATLGEGGEIFVLDMGEPVRIKDLAQDICIFYGKKFDEKNISYTGLRPGEKLRESLIAAGERKAATRSGKIFRVTSKEMVDAGIVTNTVQTICAAVAGLDKDAILQAIHSLVPQYVRKEENQHFY